jgi:hypothetical protein
MRHLGNVFYNKQYLGYDVICGSANLTQLINWQQIISVSLRKLMKDDADDFFG